MKHICFISNRYPNILTPTRQVFVQKLVWELADMGVSCTVISPVPVNQYLSTFSKLPLEAEEVTPNGAVVKLYFPRYISLGQISKGPIKTSPLTALLFTSAVRKVFKKLANKPNIVYGHFLAPAGVCAARIGREFGIPSFAAFGESTTWSITAFGKQKIKKDLSTLSGIVSVSTANKKVLQQLDIFPDEKVKVFPNGIKGKVFYPRDKEQARKEFGFDKDKFLVSYVGQFSERKGVMRAAEAVDGLEGTQIAFAGKGKLLPATANCVHKSAVAPQSIPDFLSASDVFVLPTMNEGCSNAIIEAMACGLPIVSADLPFNEDILTTDNAILVDPANVQEIRAAVVKIKSDPV
jgi:teichuronic acid biosynthesis glycosyltransferase TuaC